jgi:NAD-dependent dihydropyrimidine dehydrogenase PreA subunit
MSKPLKILLCRCVHASFVPVEVSDALAGRLREAGLAVEVVDDLCGLAARRDPAMAEFIRAADDSAAIVACFPRTIRWLLDWAQSPLPPAARVFNLRTQSTDEVFASLSARAVVGEAIPNSEFRIPHPEFDGWIPWFPVIDYDRCKSCRKCANFCLFAVYSIDPDGKVRVAQPGKCKTNCPACARLCPHAAIIFPKYHAAPINGDEVTPENAAAQQVGPEFGVQIGGNLLETLRQRAIAHSPLPLLNTPSASPPPHHSPLPRGEGEIPVSVQQILDAVKDRPSEK